MLAGAWWDLWFTPWCVDEFGFSVQGASLCIAFIAAVFGTCCPLSGTLGDKLGSRGRMVLLAGAMTFLMGMYAFMGPWQVCD